MQWIWISLGFELFGVWWIWNWTCDPICIWIWIMGRFFAVISNQFQSIYTAKTHIQIKSWDNILLGLHHWHFLSLYPLDYDDTTLGVFEVMQQEGWLWIYYHGDTKHSEWYLHMCDGERRCWRNANKQQLTSHGLSSCGAPEDIW